MTLRSHERHGLAQTAAVAIAIVVIIAGVAGYLLYTNSTQASTSTSTTSQPAPGEFNQTLVSEAVKEGSLTVYQGIIPADLATALEQVFQSQFPKISTNVQSVLSPILIQKITAEVKSNHGIADAILLPSQIDMAALDQQGIFQPYNSPAYSNFQSRFVAQDYEYFFPAQFATFLAYNSQVLNKSGLPPPTSWCDLANPAYKGLVGIGVAWGGLTYIMHYTLFKTCGGLSFYRSLANNKPKLEEFPNTAADLASGAIGIAPGLDYLIQPLIQKGAPIKIVAPKEGIIDALVGAAISKVAPVPAAARLFIDWLASPQGQLALQQVQGYTDTSNGAQANALNPLANQEIQWFQSPVNTNFNVSDMIQQEASLKTQVYGALNIPTS